MYPELSSFSELVDSLFDGNHNHDLDIKFSDRNIFMNDVLGIYERSERGKELNGGVADGEEEWKRKEFGIWIILALGEVLGLGIKGESENEDGRLYFEKGLKMFELAVGKEDIVRARLLLHDRPIADDLHSLSPFTSTPLRRTHVT